MERGRQLPVRLPGKRLSQPVRRAGGAGPDRPPACDLGRPLPGLRPPIPGARHCGRAAVRGRPGFAPLAGALPEHGGEGGRGSSSSMTRTTRPSPRATRAPPSAPTWWARWAMRGRCTSRIRSAVRLRTTRPSTARSPVRSPPRSRLATEGRWALVPSSSRSSPDSRARRRGRAPATHRSRRAAARKGHTLSCCSSVIASLPLVCSRSSPRRSRRPSSMRR